METWTDLCRCCLSAKSEVSLLDKEQNIAQKFLEVTTIEVKADDGLPQKLCGECLSTMNSAYHFRKQCIKMDTELKIQFSNLINQCNNKIVSFQNEAEKIDMDIEFANDPMKQLEAVIKKEPMDSDDDVYYVLVIDNPKDKENGDESVVKLEPPDMEANNKTTVDSTEMLTVNVPCQELEEILPHISESHVEEQESNHADFDNTVESFLMTDIIPANVPATIMQNEDDSQDVDNNDENTITMEVGETQDSTSQEPIEYQVENSQDNIVGEITDQNLIKILTSSAQDGTILLKNDDGTVQYLTDGQLIVNEEDGEHTGQEVILCEGDESQFQIVKYDGSELVIEYDTESSIATVLQQQGDGYVCECGESFEDPEEFEKHQQKHNPAGDHLCNLCGKGFESPEILTGHMLLHQMTSHQIQCPFCEQVVKRAALTQHIKYSHNNIKPVCEVCNKTFANPNNLKRHMMIHSGIKEFECDICNKRFHQKISMQTHKLTHMNPLSCWQCGKTFKDKEGFEQHKFSGDCPKNKAKELMNTVKQEITSNLGKLLGYSCSLCKKMFSIESALERHIENAHILDPAELLCSECGEVCTSKKEMQVHLLTHDKRKPTVKRFQCGTCGKGCSSQAMLIMHERVHTNERPYPCQLCPLKFKTKTHLRTHQLTHTREKKFGCSVCMKFFALKGNLVVHLRTHTGERPYVCSVCGEAFIDSKYLKKHHFKKHAIDNVAWNKYLLKVKTQEEES